MRRGLQVVLTVLGLVAVFAGLLTVLTGVSTLPDPDGASASVDSEMRFYAAWYVGAGALVLRASRRPEAAGAVVRGVSALLLLAAFGRGISWAVEGAPHWSQVVLLVLEVVIPAVLVPWQAAVSRMGSARQPAQ